MKADFVYLFFSVFLGACGQLLLKCSVGKLGGVRLEGTSLVPSLLRIFTSGGILLGVVFFVLSMVLWLRVLSAMELSRAYPTVSISYLVVLFLSAVFLGEPLTWHKVAGVFFIVLGVLLIHR